jgi:hypothetical protein
MEELLENEVRVTAVLFWWLVRCIGVALALSVLPSAIISFVKEMYSLMSPCSLVLVS